jgi:hypothetical protein
MNLNAAIIDQRLYSVCDAIRDRAWVEWKSMLDYIALKLTRVQGLE